MVSNHFTWVSCITTFPLKIWAKRCALYMAKCGRLCTSQNSGEIKGTGTIYLIENDPLKDKKYKKVHEKR